MDTDVLDSIKIERIPGTEYVRLLEPFLFYSVVLRSWCAIPKGFIYDEESVPVLRGTNPEAGAVHDYLCRKDSIPLVDKKTAAAVYQEFQAYYDNMEMGFFNKIWDWVKRQFKTDVVKVAPDYFHKHRVNASYEEMSQ